jgi:hypothetical protein
MDLESRGIYKALTDAWQDVTAAIGRLSGSAAMQPNDPAAVLRVSDTSDDNVVRFEIRPVVFKLPRRNGRSSKDLFVVVRGLLSFSRSAYRERRALMTQGFSTEVGYFFHDHSVFTHVYGAHYDFDLNAIGHPAFHAQMKSFADFASFITEQFRINGTVVDLVKGLLKTVRVPSAQMDVFSVYLQILADHLVHERSAPEERAAFNTLLQKSGFCQGAAPLVPRLIRTEASQCYRARHWYPAAP